MDFAIYLRLGTIVIRYILSSSKNNVQKYHPDNMKRFIISEEPNNAIINEEISSAENLDNQELSKGTRIQNEKSDVIILYDSRPPTREQGQKSDDVNNGLELTPDEQAERVNLFMLGFASIILMNAMAVLIIVFVKVSKYQDQLVIKSNIMKKQIKGKKVMTPVHS